MLLTMKHLVIRLLLLSSALSPLVADAGSPVIVPATEAVAGRSQLDWSPAWWQWAHSFDRAESPVADKQGSRCHLKQEGAVWFLAGTYGTKRTIRTCTVPAGKYLFFPLINYVIYPREGYPLTCDQARKRSADLTDDPSALVLEIDGTIYEHLRVHRQSTRKCFDLAAPAGGGLAPAAADGYYIMLRPLRRGTHTINFGGILPGMAQAVTYTLHVE